MDPGRKKLAPKTGTDWNTGKGRGEANRSGYYPGKVRGFFEMIPRDHRPAKMPKAKLSAGNVGGTRKATKPVPFPTGKTSAEKAYEKRTGRTKKVRNKLGKDIF